MQLKANTDQVGVLYTILTTVLFVFPPDIPVTGNSMNYCIVAFAIVVIISGIQWIVDGRKNYKGPQIDVDALMEGQVEGMAPGEPSAADRPEKEKNGV